MGVLTSEHPKCMTEVSSTQTILSRQLHMLVEAGITEVVITTGYYDSVLVSYCESLDLPLHYTFVKNPIYDKTNYIYSIYSARKELDDDILLMHGDLVFENEVMDRVMQSPVSCMTISSTLPLPEKDFKAQIKDGKVINVGVDIFTDAVEAQAFYKLYRDDWNVWLHKIIEYCEDSDTSKRTVYAENALNELNGTANITALDVQNLLCAEIDNPEDLAVVKHQLKTVESRTVYMSFSTDILHGGHIAIIKKALRHGRLIIGVLSDEAVASYKRFPMVSFEDRKIMFENIAGVYQVVEQKTLSYRENLEKYKPDIVVHGDDWKNDVQKPIRDEVVSILATYGGKLIEYPYSTDKRFQELDSRTRANLSMPDVRRGRLKRMLEVKGFLTAMEAHDGLTGLIVENTKVHQDGGAHQFDAIWISSLCDSTAKGKPDIELVDLSSRFRTIEDITEVTTKPIIFDGGRGGRTEHFIYNVRSLERLGVSMVIIDDQLVVEKDDSYITNARPLQDSITHFSAKIRAGKKAQRTPEFMICARIESLVCNQNIEDALSRAIAYTQAGADAIMIQSKKNASDEIKAFIEAFRAQNKTSPIVLAPTYNHSLKEDEWKACGANMVIYTNQLMRAQVPAMQRVAELILENHRSKECDEMLMPFKDILQMIPTED